MNTTLDQWEVLEAVVQLGSFAAAASSLNRSQSTISYTISHLQEQVKVPLLEMKGRRAQLTRVGKALLADAEPLLAAFRALETRASSLASGGDTEISLSVDSMYPNDRLFAALEEMMCRYPHVHPRLQKGALIASASEFASFGADLCITSIPAHEQLIKPILDIRMRAVARADHPLVKAGRKTVSRAEIIQHLAVIIEGRTGAEVKRQPHAPSQRFLTVNTIESGIGAVRTGLCFGWLPVYRIADLLESGELVTLRLPIGGEWLSRLYLVFRDMDTITREKTMLADLLGANRELEVM